MAVRACGVCTFAPGVLTHVGRAERVGALPEWIKKIEEVAANSKTLRIKIGRKQAQNPDLLSFRYGGQAAYTCAWVSYGIDKAGGSCSERMLFFTSGAVESNIKGSALPMPDKKPPQFRNAVVPRETAAVAANKPKAAVQAAGYVRR
jgi:hypothetical protein